MIETNEDLRARNIRLQADLHIARGELADLKAEHEKLATGLAARADAARAAEHSAAEQEENRRLAWYNFSVSKFTGAERPSPSDDAEFKEFLSKDRATHIANAPAEGWPPGYEPSQFTGVHSLPPDQPEGGFTKIAALLG